MFNLASATDVSACSNLTSAGVYTLNQSVTADTTCMNIYANDITLDCNGTSINFANTGAGIGVYSNASNTTVKNCNIEQGTVGSTRVGISASGGSATITNNTFTMKGDFGDDTTWAIYLNSNSNVLVNNTINGTSDGYLRYPIYFFADYNNVTNTTFYLYKSYDMGFYFNWGADYNNINISNIYLLAGSGNMGIAKILGHDNNFTNIYVKDDVGNNGYFYFAWTQGNNIIKDVLINNTGSTEYSSLLTKYGGSEYDYFINVTTINVPSQGGFGYDGFGIKRYWYADTYVNDTSGNPLNATNVSIYNVSSVLINTQLTNTSGYVPSRQTLLQYMQNQTAKYDETNYSFNATKTGYTNNAVAVNLTDNRLAGTNPVVITLTASGGGDTTAPTFTTIPANASLWFGNQTLGVDFDATDETAFGGFYVNDTKFSINSTGWLTNATVVGTGFYTINVTINDTSNNKNWTLYSVTINKNNYTCDVLYNETSPLIYPKTFRVYTNCNSGFVLYRNGTAIANNTEQNVGTGFWNFSVTRNDTTNYTYIYDTEYFTIQANTGICDIVFNTTSPKTYPSIFVVYTNCNSAFTLRRNNTAITNNTAQALASNTWNFSVQRTDAINYSFNYDDDNFIIAKATTNLDLVISPDMDSIYPTETTTTGSECTTTCTLYRDSIAKSNPEVTTLGIGIYNYTYNTTGNENYTSDSISNNLTISQNTGLCDVLFNTTSPKTYPSRFKVYTNCNSAFTLYRNGTAITNNSEQDIGNGYWNFSVARTDTGNYTNLYDTEFFTITKNTGVCDVLFNTTSPKVYPSTFQAYSNCNSAITLYRNGTSTTNNSAQDVGVGYWNYSVSRTDKSNYTNLYDTEYFTITKATTSLSLGASPSWTEESGVETTVTGSGCTTTCGLFIDGTATDNPDVQTLAVGIYNYTYNTTGNANYTADSESNNLTILYVDLENPLAEMGTNPVDTFNSTTTSVSFELKCSDNIIVNSLQLWTNKTGTWGATATNSSAINNTIWNKTVNGFSNDDYIWGVYCNDLHGNEDWSDTNRTFTVSYTAPPSVNATGGITPICRYKKMGYYNEALPWLREVNCI